jgi:hypothetical protein
MEDEEVDEEEEAEEEDEEEEEEEGGDEAGSIAVAVGWLPSTNMDFSPSFASASSKDFNISSFC